MILDNSSPCNSVLFTSYLWYRKFFKNWLPVLWLHYRPFDFNWGENMWCLFHMLKWKNTLFRNLLDYSVEFLVVFFSVGFYLRKKKMNMISLLKSPYSPLSTYWCFDNLHSLTKESIFRSISIKRTPFCWRQQKTVSSFVVVCSCCFCYAMCNCTIVRISFINMYLYKDENNMNCGKYNCKCIYHLNQIPTHPSSILIRK